MKIMIIVVTVLNLYFGIVVYQNKSFRQRGVLEILPNSYHGSSPEVFWKYGTNLKKSTHAEVRFQ